MKNSLVIVSDSRLKRHLIILPPPKGLFLGGGGKVFRISPSFLVLKQKQHFGKSMELAGIFDDQFGRFGPIPANLWLFEIQKICDFQCFWANLATFFFKMRFWAKLVLESLKMVFLRFFRP